MPEGVEFDSSVMGLNWTDFFLEFRLVVICRGEVCPGGMISVILQRYKQTQGLECLFVCLCVSVHLSADLRRFTVG